MSQTNNINGISGNLFHPTLRAPALQAGGRGIVTLSAHHHPTENTSQRFRLNACRAQAGGLVSCPISGNLPKKCQDHATPRRQPGGGAS